jgi:hypothetical protein
MDPAFGARERGPAHGMLFSLRLLSLGLSLPHALQLGLRLFAGLLLPASTTAARDAIERAKSGYRGSSTANPTG